jgi:hypothetical protein
VFGGVLLFHPGWVVSSALAGLASGFGMGPGVSLPLWTAVTLLFVWCPTCGGEVCVFGGGVWCGRCGCVVAGLCVSFRPVSASSLSYYYVYRSGLLIPWSAGGLIPLNG